MLDFFGCFFSLSIIPPLACAQDWCDTETLRFVRPSPVLPFLALSASPRKNPSNLPRIFVPCRILKNLGKTRENAQTIREIPCFQGEIIYAPPPPFLARRHFSGRGGWGCIFRGPTRQEFYTPPPFIRPPTPRRVFSGVGGWGCMKFGPVIFVPCRILRNLGKTRENAQTIREIPCLKLTKEFQKTKERKDREVPSGTGMNFGNKPKGKNLERNNLARSFQS